MVGALVHQKVTQISEEQKDARGNSLTYISIITELRRPHCFGLEQKLHSEICKWLAPPDPSTNHEFNCTARRGQEAGQETGNWFLQSPEFIAWRDGRSSRPLWLYGKRE